MRRDWRRTSDRYRAALFLVAAPTLSTGCPGPTAAEDAGRIEAGAEDAAAPTDAQVEDAGRPVSRDAGQTLDAGVPEVPVLEACGEPSAPPFDHGTDLWGYETIPSVVAAGEAFRVEVTLPASSDETLALELRRGIAAVDGTAFHDDGTRGDRVASDRVFTAGPFYVEREGVPDTSFAADLGLGFEEVGRLTATDPSGAVREPLLVMQVGVLDAPEGPPVVTRSDRAAATDYVAEICSAGWAVPVGLRSIDVAPVQALVPHLYEVVADDIDHLMFFSTQHLERLERTGDGNFTAGRHIGPGVGSPFRANALNLFDAGSRGLAPRTVTHEILHEWGAFLPTDLGLTRGVHYSNWSSVGSLLGGFAWEPVGDGTFTRNCDVGVNGARTASPLDLYFMGLLPASELPTQRAISESRPLPGCDEVIPPPYMEVTAATLVDRLGPVTPGPGEAPTTYRVAFVVETAGRRLTSTEREFYHRLGEAYTAPITTDEPPEMRDQWVSIAGFFPGSTWHSDLSPP